MTFSISANGASGGSIVSAASIAGQRGSPWNAPYGAAKWGVIPLTKSAAQEAGPKTLERTLWHRSPDLVFQRMVSRTALQRLAQPEEIANCILLLLSDTSSFITGSMVDSSRYIYLENKLAMK